MNTDKKTLRDFATVVFVGTAVIGTLLLLKRKPVFIWFYVTGATALTAGLFAADILRPVYILWMKLAHALGWFNTRLILALIFYLLITPIGLIMRLFGADLLDKKIRKDEASYWKMREKKEFAQADYERQF